MRPILALIFAIWTAPALAGPLDDRWWGDDPAGFLVLPRAMMAEMPDEWQAGMADLLDEWVDRWNPILGPLPYRPEVGVRDTRTGRYSSLPHILFDPAPTRGR